jgi:hypothetical protein
MSIKEERTLYGDGRIRSPNKTCPRFSTGDRSPATEQKSKLEKKEVISFIFLIQSK